MHITSPVALTVLVSCLAITSLLGRTKVFGTLTLTGFVLGALSTASLFILFQ